MGSKGLRFKMFDLELSTFDPGFLNQIAFLDFDLCLNLGANRIQIFPVIRFETHNEHILCVGSTHEAPTVGEKDSSAVYIDYLVE